MTDHSPHTDREPLPDGTGDKHERFPKRTIFFGVCTVVAILVYCIAHADSFTALFSRLVEVCMPIIIGGVIAYLCNPILKLYEFWVFRRLKSNSLRRGLSLLLTVVTVIGVLTLILALIIPELVDSISQLFGNYEYYLNGLLAFVQGIIDRINATFGTDIDVSNMQKLTALIEDMFGSMENAVSKLLATLQGFLLDGKLLNNIWGFLAGLFNTFKNVILGIFIAFYILSSKEKRVAQINKFRRALFTEKRNRRISEIVSLVDRTFGGFIKGILLDALAVGIVTFILLSIFRVSDYNLLISVICAITNIIPVFGPFIGAIPSALIVLISNPEKFLLFIILVVVIQQIDGNILCPRIQGNNTGVSSLAVLIAITVMGGLFGLMGMVLGVPIFAVIIELFKQAIERKLAKAGAPTDTTHYYPADALGNADEEVHYEHAHLKYVYDHSKLKPYVDRAIRAVKGLRKKQQNPGGDEDEADHPGSGDSSVT